MISIGQIVEVIEESAKKYQKSRAEENKNFNLKNSFKSNATGNNQDIIYKYRVRIPLLHGA